MNLGERQEIIEALLKAVLIVQKHVEPHEPIQFSTSVVNWENGPLGKDERFVRRSSRKSEKAVDKALGINRGKRRKR